MFTISIVVIAILIILGLISHYYVKVGPNEVLIVTGGCLNGPYVEENASTHTRVKVIKGGGCFVIPVIQQAQVQSLDTFNIDVDVKDVMTVDSVPVNASANAVLRVGSDPKMIAVASEKMLGLSKENRDAQMVNVVKGAVREALTQMTPKQANDRRSFQEAVVAACKPTFDNLGLEITSLKITSIDDDNGYYESLSAKDIADKQAEAAKAQAEADRESRQAQAQADQEAKISELEAANAIAAKQKEVDIAKAQYDAQVAKEKAVADKASDIARAEQDAIIQEKKFAVATNELKATKIAQQTAEKEAQQIKADGDFYAMQQKANAEAYATTQAGNAESEKIAKIGSAKADAQEALAVALSKQGAGASLASKIIDLLPQIAQAYAEQLGHVDKLTVLNGAQGLNQMSASTINSAIEMIKNTTGVDLVDIIQKRAKGTLTVDDDNQSDFLKTAMSKYANIDKTLAKKNHVSDADFETIKPKAVKPETKISKPKHSAEEIRPEDMNF